MIYVHILFLHRFHVKAVFVC